MMVLDQRVQSDRPEEDMNVLTSFQNNTFNSFRDILLQTSNINLMVALEKKTTTIWIRPFGIMKIILEKLIWYC